MLLIITTSNDSHCRSVEAGLRSRAETVIRLNTDTLLGDNTELSTFISGAKNTVLFSIPPNSYDLAAVRSVWLRRSYFNLVLPQTYPEGTATFIRNETHTFLSGLWHLLLDRFWVSPPEAVSFAENKMRQLADAAMLGLSVPRTLVTTNPSSALEFFHLCDGNVLVKPLRYGLVPQHDGTTVLFATSVDSSHLPSLDLVRTAPTMFQEIIPNRHELRITVVGTDLFACALHTQPGSKIDWRRAPSDIDYKPTVLPSYVAEGCLRLMKHFGLRYGAIDMIVTSDDEYIFLEVNPCGRFLWIEERTGLRITDALVELIIKGHP